MNNCGILIFAHNNDKIDYFKLAILSGVLASKNLNLPVSVVTDSTTLSEVKNQEYFLKHACNIDEIIEIDPFKTSNFRNYKAGTDNYYLEFINDNRYKAFELTPYDRTLIIDSDYLILSDNLNSYLQLDSDLLISESCNDIMMPTRLQYNNIYVSSVGVKLKWATTVLFSKNNKTRLFFNLVKHIYDNYYEYSRIYRFDSRMYRNDIAFSVAYHILNGYDHDTNYELPPILSILDTDNILGVENKKIFFSIDPRHADVKLVSLENQDVHVMNKMSLLENFDKLIDL